MLECPESSLGWVGKHLAGMLLDRIVDLLLPSQLRHGGLTILQTDPVYQAAAMSNGLDLMLDITNPVGR
jgi:hypothetical protein